MQLTSYCQLINEQLPYINLFDHALEWPDSKTTRTGQNEWFILNYQL